jgi:hypothetical protein
MPFSVASVRSFRPRPYHAAAALFFVVVGAVFYGSYLNDLPTSIHTWAQSDRLALALNFYDYGFHFFKPRTYTLESIGGVTGVEFPLQAYLAALGGLVFGRGSIITLFRLLDVAVLLLGFYYLFRIVFERTGHFVAALVPGAFLLASPFFAFYAGGFLPDPFSLSLSFIGYYYWLRFFDTYHYPDLRLAVLVLGLAALIKTTIALHLGAVAGITLVWIFVQPNRLALRQRLEFLGLLAAMLGLIAFFFIHNQTLNETYQSGQFLATIRPISDLEVQHEVLHYVRISWLNEYATITQYRTLGVCVVLLLVYSWRNLRRNLPLTLLLLGATAIGLLFVKLMGVQFQVHDYYAICSLIPPALLLLVLGLLNIAQYTGKLVRYGSSAGLAVLVFFLVASGYKRLNQRSSDDYPPFSPFNHVWMRGGAEELAQAGVPAAANILAFNEPSPNIPLVYFDRRGLTWIPPAVNVVTAEDFVRRMANDSLDYVVMAPNYYAQLPENQHDAMNAEFEVVGRTPAVILRRRNRDRPW